MRWLSHKPLKVKVDIISPVGFTSQVWETAKFWNFVICTGSLTMQYTSYRNGPMDLSYQS